MNIENKILELRKLLHRHNHLYYILDKPEISDFEFDQMLKDLEPEFFGKMLYLYCFIFKKYTS